MSAQINIPEVSAPDPRPVSASRASGDPAGPTREVLVFELGGQRYGLPTLDVSELVRAVAITRLPDAPAFIEGVVNVRGRILPVLDIRARFHLPAKPLDPSDHFIVASAGARGVILRVDRAIHLALVDDSSVQAAQALGSSATYVAGVAKLDGGLVLIHDLATFLSAAESASLDTVLQARASG